MKFINRYLTSTALLAVTFGLFGTAQAGIITINGPPAESVDTDPATVVQLNVAETGTILDLNLAMNIVDPYCVDLPEDDCSPGVYWGDWDITLSHNGMSALVFSQDDDDNGLFDVVFDDESSNAVPDCDDCDLVGDYQPLNPLSIFDGKELSGLWELSILDTVIPDDDEDLASWSLIVTVDKPGAVPEPSIMALFAAGLFGLGVARRRMRS